MLGVKQLVRIRHGSHLYGTSTPSSDQDFKGVHLPSGQSLILQKAENVIDRQIKVSTTIKNTFEDVDDQSYSLQKFLKMLSEGDTVATEILFANDANIIETTPEWAKIKSFSSYFLNRQCKGFVGYCQRQAAKYGIKGSRMAACKAIIDVLSYYMLRQHSCKLELIRDHLEAFCADHEFSQLINIPTPQGVDVWHIEVVDRKVPFTATIKTAYDLFTKIYDNYGDRAKQAINNSGIDWKAVSHAVRVSRQAIELLSTHAITFPRSDATELLDIKLGKVPYSTVSPLLEGLVEEVERVSLISTLPEKSDIDMMEALVQGLYLTQITGK